MAGILDFLTGNDAAASPYGALYQSPLTDEEAKRQAAAADLLASMGISPANATANAAPSPFTAPAPAPAAPAFGAGATPFGFAGPASTFSPANAAPSASLAPAPAPAAPAAPANTGMAGPGSMLGIDPAMISAPAAPPQVTQQPAPPATDLSSVNQPAPAPANAPDSVVNVGNYKMPMYGEAPDDEPQAAPAAPAVAPGAPSSPAPFSLAGAGNAVGDRLMKGTRGFMGNLALGPVGALVGGLGALVSGRNTDPTSIAKEKTNSTLQALVGKGAPVGDVVAAANNPALMTALIQQYYGKDKYKVQQTGEDGMGQKTFQLFNESDGTFKPIPGATAAGAGAGGGAGGGIGDMSKKGADYLATVPPAQRNTIQMMLSGDLPPPTSFAMAKPYWQNMIAAARNVDPNFTETNWAGRVSMARSAQGDGKMGQNNNSIITGIGHLMQLNDAIPALNNSEHSQTYNRLSNAASTEFGGTGATNFAAVANRVAPEIVKIWRGTGGAEADIKRDIESLNTSQTPSQLRGAISNIAGMMRAKLESNQQEYRATMGRDLPMTPEQQQTLSLLDRMAGGGSAAPSAAASVRGTVNVGGKPISWSVN